MASTRRDATVTRVVPTQDYQQLSNIKKKFEPYFQLWDTADQWLTASAQWHSSSFVSLEAEQIEQIQITIKMRSKRPSNFLTAIIGRSVANSQGDQGPSETI